MKLPSLIKEAILQAIISLKELNEGKIYGGILETHLYKLARYSKVELHEIRRLGNENLARECREIFQEAKEAYEILKKFEHHGLEDSQVERIRILLRRIMALENLVREQTQGMTRREIIRKGILATAASHIFGTRAFGEEPQTRPQVSQPIKPRSQTSRPQYYLIDFGKYNEDFFRQVIGQEYNLVTPLYIIRQSKGGFRNLSTEETSLEEISANDIYRVRFDPHGNYTLGLLNDLANGYFPRKYDGSRIILLTTFDFLLDSLPGEKISNIRKTLMDRNIEFYVYCVLNQPLNAQNQNNLLRNIFGFATRLYSTPNLDRNEFRRVIREWKQ